MPFGHGFRVCDSFDEAPGPSFGTLEAIPSEGLIVHYNETSMVTDGSGWNDISGNEKHLTQANPVWRPSYVASGIGGLPTFRFEGEYNTATSQGLYDQTVGFLPLAGKIGMTLIVVGQLKDVPDPTAGNSVVYIGMAPSALTLTHQASPVRDAFFSPGDTRARVPNIGVDVPFIWVSTVNRDTELSGETFHAVSRQNGDAPALTTVYGGGETIGTANGGIVIGSPDSYSVTLINDEWISEVLVYDRTLPITEINSIQAELATKYSITATPWVTYDT